MLPLPTTAAATAEAGHRRRLESVAAAPRPSATVRCSATTVVLRSPPTKNEGSKCEVLLFVFSFLALVLRL